MHAADVLRYGDRTLRRTLKGLPAADWTTAGVCGWWSVREIVAHLASFEYILIDALAIAAGNDAPGSYFSDWQQDAQKFNDDQVAARGGLTVDDTLAEYAAAQTRAATLLAALPPAALTLSGLLPAYGAEYDLDDFLAYTFYGHKREHAAQIAVFRDHIRR